ncbi:hypothetical protein CH358_19320 [Leptospira meyeri]|nr:hypothetical protein CH358_19320 [Leptospira meyeri]
MYFTGGLLLFGLLGDQIIGLFSKIVKSRIDSFLKQDDGKSLIDEQIKETIKKQFHENPLQDNITLAIKEQFSNTEFKELLIKVITEDDKFKEFILDGFASNNNPMIENTISKTDISIHYNTVIVPVGWSIDWNLKYKIYFCQKGRTFRQSQYIALYARRTIHYISKRIPISSEEIKKKALADTEFNLSLIKMKIDLINDDLDFYDLSEDGQILNIHHSGPIALTMNQIYSSRDSLIRASNTKDIDREKNVV